MRMNFIKFFFSLFISILIVSSLYVFFGWFGVWVFIAFNVVLACVIAWKHRDSIKLFITWAVFFIKGGLK